MDPITAWAFAMLALLALIMIFTGVGMIYLIRTYHLLNESGSPYTTAPLVPIEQAV